MDTTAVEPEAGGSFALAIPAGLVAAVVGAVLWAAVVYATHMKLGLVAIAVGALVGVAVRTAGRGAQPAFGILGGLCAAVGWALGTLFCAIAFIAKANDLGVLDVALRADPGKLLGIVIGALGPMDALFFGIAVYEGWKFALAGGRR